MILNREEIKDIIRKGVSAGTFSIDDILIEANKLLEESVKNALKHNGGKILFTDDYPHMVSCCFSQVQELDIKEILFDKELIFLL